MRRAVPAPPDDDDPEHESGRSAELRARADAEQAQARLAFLAQAGNVLSESLDLQTTLDSLATLATERLADWFAVHLVDDDRLRLAVLAHRDATGADVPEAIRRAIEALGAADVIGSGRSRLHLDGPDAGVHGADSGFSSAMVVPLTARGRTFGAMTFLQAESGRRFGEADLLLTELLGRRAALAIENARLFSEVNEAERRVRTLVESVDAVLWAVDAQTLEFTFVSQRAETLLGYPLRRWLEGGFWTDIVHPDDRDRVAAAYREAARTRASTDLDYRVVAADGRVLWLRDVVHETDRASDGRELRGIKLDVTARRRSGLRQDAEQAVARALAESDSLVRAAPHVLEAIGTRFDWAAGCIWTSAEAPDTLRRVAFWTAPGEAAPALEAATRELQLDVGRGLPGRAWASAEATWLADLGSGDDVARAAAAVQDGLRAGLAFPAVTTEGVLAVVELLARSSREPDEDVLRTASTVGSQLGQFIERTRAEEQLRFQTSVLRSQNEATVDGILVISADGRPLSYNSRFLEMWGIAPDAVSPGSDVEALGLVVRELADPDAIVERGRYLMEHPQERSREEVDLRDGRTFDLWSSPLTGDDGEYFGRAWFFRDITWRRRSEDMLRRGRERSEFLATAGAQLAASLDTGTTLERLAAVCVPALADWCVVDVAEQDGSIRRAAVAASGRGGVLRAADPRVAAVRESAVDPEQDHPVARVLRTGRPEIVEDTPGSRLDDLLPRVRARSGMVLPLVVRERVLGTVALVHAGSGRVYSRADLALAEDLCARGALAVDNARLYQDRSHVARTLQESLLPPILPSLPFADIAACYHSAREGADVGGDFYDLFATRGETWSIVIGDVCGKGAEAAALTALARYTIRAAAMQARKPSRILRVLNDAIVEQRSDRRFCTVAYATLRPEAGGARMVVSCGGHPLPLVLRAGGTIEPVGAPGTLLGLFPDPHLTDTEVRLQTGDTVVFFTDGVTEVPGPHGMFTDAMLAAVLREARGSGPAEVVRRVETAVLEFQQGTPRDDVAVLALRIRG